MIVSATTEMEVLQPNPTPDDAQGRDEETVCLDRARAGGADAFARLAEAHEARLYRQAVALCGSATDAEDLEAGWCVARPWSHQPTAFYFGARALGFADLMQVVWEGLEDDRWSVEQLGAIEDLASAELLPAARARIQFQLLAHADLIESVIPTRPPASGRPPWFTEDEGTLRWVRRLYPRGWSLQDQAALHAFHGALADPSGMADGAEGADEETEIAQARWLMRRSSDPGFAVFVVPKVVQGMQDSRDFGVFGEAVLRLTRVACALERHRRRAGEYPERLEDVEMSGDPAARLDPVDGHPLRYRRVGTGGYHLYSVCLDGRDDGGVEPPEPRLSPVAGQPGWDWVWRRSGAAAGPVR